MITHSPVARRARSYRRRRLFFFGAASLLAAGATACAPRRAPGPTPPAPTAQPAPPSAPPAAPPAGPRAWSFAYAPGHYAYRVVTTAAIEPRSDSVARAESLTTTAVVSYAITRGASGGTLAVDGTVDTFTVQSYAGRPAPPPPQLPLHFRATVGADGQVTEFRGDTTLLGCSAAAAAAIALARETVVGVPAQLTPGLVWDDSTTSNECPGGTPLTIAARRHYEVHDLEPHGQGTALRVTRTSDVRINGAGAQRGLPLSVGGGGTGRTELFLDPQAGRLLGSTSEYEVSVTIEAAGARHEIAQRVRQTVELIER